MSTLATADDIEIYLQEPPDPVPPNVLFVLDESGSMSSGRPSRRDRLEQAMRTLINDPEMGNVNAALLGYTTRWNNNGPLYLRAHSGNFSIIEDNRATFLNAADNLQTISYTPTVKAMEAAVNWFRRDRTFVDYNGFTTVSPIDGVPQDNWCRPNHMVVLTDGRPNSNSPTSGQAYGLTEYPTGTTCASDSTSNWQNGRCAREIAGWAYTTDMETGDGWDEVQNIVTHTIGFDTNDVAIENFMRSIATAGGGSYYPATSVSDLVSAFTSIVATARQSIPYAYTAPVVPFNQDNAAVSGNRIFVPTLVPAAEVFWTGNLKSYTISTSTSGGATAVVITDADGDPIVNDRYEFISSRDHWNSTGEDGGNPLVGGAAEQMTASGFRNLFTNTNPSAALSHASNRVHRDNDLVTYALLGVADGDDATREALLNWISWDPTLTGDASHEGVMGAPIHTQPAVMEYNSGDVIFLPTTEGVLEAIDEETGQELWAFMPSDLLGGIQTIFNNNPSTIPYYGLDGPLTVYETQGRKMAIVGMRRGGRNYYMLDITDRENPSFVTTVNAASGLSRLGQTWSKPLFVTMEIGGGSARDVLIFGGGYDPDQDNVTTNRANDDEGNAIYIIDARDGSLVTTISSDGSADLTIGDMRNSIAGNLLPVDINANNVIDRLYATDVGGRVIRVDIPDSEFADTSMAGGIIADIYAPGELRKFFNTPEVGYYNIGSTQYLAILVGSGNRSNPLDVSVTDRFYMIKDPGVWTKPITYVTVAHDELYDATANLVQDGTADQQGAARNSLALLKGWFIDLGYSEKSYSKAVLYDYLVLFTTFSAERSVELAACEARGASGVGRAYAVNMRDASAVIDGFGGSFGTLDRGDRTKVLRMLGIPPSPALVFPEGEQAATLGNVVKALVGLEEVAEWPERLRPISWEEVIE
ncbi:MAG: VWA domain-containing protein [Candidatus Thiodiazotropha sp.]